MQLSKDGYELANRIEHCNTEINAGWSLYPVAYLPGQSTFEMSITSGKFEADLFVMTNATNFETNSAYQVPVTEVLTPDGANEVDLAHKPITGTVSIAGLEETAQTVVSGRYKVVDGEITKIQFAAGDIADTVTVSYFYAAEAQEANIDNRSSAMGEAIMVGIYATL